MVSHRGLYLVGSVVPGHRFDDAIDAVLLAVRPRRVIQGVRLLGGDAVTEGDAPQAIDAYATLRPVTQAAEESSGARVECVDGAVAEVADQKRPPKPAK